MKSIYTLTTSSWEMLLSSLINEYEVYAPIPFENNLEYTLLDKENQKDIRYNSPKPSTPLKAFFLPVKENVVAQSDEKRNRIIIGAPSCDLSGLSILDEIYLDKDYVDPFYARRRDQTLLFGFDCHSIQEHCHCNAYGFSPVPTDNADVLVSQQGETILLNVISEKGGEFAKTHLGKEKEAGNEEISKLAKLREKVAHELKTQQNGLPDYQHTGKLVYDAAPQIWEKYGDSCVSCGACSAICPTCSCFLFIERPEFEKIRNIDTCQYPGFERVAAGEDPLRPLHMRFRNRYMCKYVWKPEKYDAKACTGCGRCIEACIGNIDKNALFRELNSKETAKA